MPSQELSLLTNEDALGSIKTFEDALAVLQDAGVVVRSTDDLGTGFRVLPTSEKHTLVNVPFVVLAYEFHVSKERLDKDGNGLPFSAMHIVTKDGRKLIVTDGSTGIMADLRKYQAKGQREGILAPRGLTVSEYDYVHPDGSREPSKTFYLS